jgi:hypothetical protein
MSGEHREYVDLQDAARQQINLPGLLHEIVFVVVVVFYLVRLMARVLMLETKPRAAGPRITTACA